MSMSKVFATADRLGLYLLESVWSLQEAPYSLERRVQQYLGRHGEHPLGPDPGEDVVDVMQQLWSLFGLQPAETLTNESLT
jgi:hypothetical protein